MGWHSEFATTSFLFSLEFLFYFTFFFFFFSFFFFFFFFFLGGGGGVGVGGGGLGEGGGVYWPFSRVFFRGRVHRSRYFGGILRIGVKKKRKKNKQLLLN